MHKHPLFNTLTLTIFLGVSALTMPVLAEEMVNSINADESTDRYNNDWKTPMAAEFTRLDASGNGLLMPHEAAKGKAFTKKTFAKADADRDGTIDQNEYESFKTGAETAGVQPENSSAPEAGTNPDAITN